MSDSTIRKRGKNSHEIRITIGKDANGEGGTALKEFGSTAPDS